MSPSNARQFTQWSAVSLTFIDMTPNNGTAADGYAHQVERAIFDLRRGIPVIVEEDADLRAPAVMVYPVESMGEAELADALAAATETPSLTLTAHRLSAMGLNIHGESASLPLKNPGQIAPALLHSAAVAIEGDCHEVFENPRPATTAERAALALMRRALLVPAVLTVRLERTDEAIDRAVADGRLLRIRARAAERCFESGAGMLRRVSEADVPLAESARSRFVLFREPDGLREHVAVLIGDPQGWPEAVPTRLHSACLTGDLFGSLRCDCGEQLQNAVRTIADLGGGVLLYLAQEGRGIGLANKLRAYSLQDSGLDTVDADRALGFGEDGRRYRVAVDMLTSLAVRRVKLLTNNPAKLRALQDGGIEVAARDGLYGRVTPHNRRYLQAKARRSGHLLDDVLDHS
jgi:GTP cyclohydrolase II